MEAKWRSVREVPPPDMVCELKFRDALGEHVGRGEYFFHDDRRWYKIDPPTQVQAHVVAWRPKLTTPPTEE